MAAAIRTLLGLLSILDASCSFWSHPSPFPGWHSPAKCQENCGKAGEQLSRVAQELGFDPVAVPKLSPALPGLPSFLPAGALGTSSSPSVKSRNNSRGCTHRNPSHPQLLGVGLGMLPLCDPMIPACCNLFIPLVIPSFLQESTIGSIIQEPTTLLLIPCCFPTSVPAGKSPAFPFPCWKRLDAEQDLLSRTQSCVKLRYFGGFINQTLYKVILYRTASESWI